MLLMQRAPVRLRSQSRPLPQIIGQNHRRLAVQVYKTGGHTTSTLSLKESCHPTYEDYRFRSKWRTPFATSSAEDEVRYAASQGDTTGLILRLEWSQNEANCAASKAGRSTPENIPCARENLIGARNPLEGQGVRHPERIGRSAGVWLSRLH
jgi:hypothetical protein